MLPEQKFNLHQKLAPICKIGALLSVFCLFIYFSYHIIHPDLPSKKNPILFYSNQTGDDLKKIILKGIKETKLEKVVLLSSDQDLKQNSSVEDISEIVEKTSKIFNSWITFFGDP